jgi:hypothetical protein
MAHAVGCVFRERVFRRAFRVSDCPGLVDPFRSVNYFPLESLQFAGSSHSAGASHWRPSTLSGRSRLTMADGQRLRLAGVQANGRLRLLRGDLQANH